MIKDFISNCMNAVKDIPSKDYSIFTKLELYRRALLGTCVLVSGEYEETDNYPTKLSYYVKTIEDMDFNHYMKEILLLDGIREHRDLPTKNFYDISMEEFNDIEIAVLEIIEVLNIRIEDNIDGIVKRKKSSRAYSITELESILMTKKSEGILASINKVKKELSSEPKFRSQPPIDKLVRVMPEVNLNKEEYGKEELKEVIQEVQSEAVEIAQPKEEDISSAIKDAMAEAMKDIVITFQDSTKEIVNKVEVLTTTLKESQQNEMEEVKKYIDTVSSKQADIEVKPSTIISMDVPDIEEKEEEKEEEEVGVMEEELLLESDQLQDIEMDSEEEDELMISPEMLEAWT